MSTGYVTLHKAFKLQCRKGLFLRERKGKKCFIQENEKEKFENGRRDQKSTSQTGRKKEPKLNDLRQQRSFAQFQDSFHIFISLLPIISFFDKVN